MGARIEGTGTGMMADETTEIDRETPESGRVHLALHLLPLLHPLPVPPLRQIRLSPHLPQVLHH